MTGRGAKNLLVAALAALGGAGALAATTVVTADRMLDVLSGRMVERPAIVVADGRIRAVLVQGDAAIPQDAARIELPGQTLLPGLIDMHVHLAADARIDGNHYLDYTDAFWVAVGVANAKAMLEAGFTTVRNVGSDDYADVGIKQAVDSGYVPGPRIVPATYALGATGGHCDGTEGLPPSFAAVPTPSVADSPDGFRALVRRVHKFGAEVIKLCVTGGVLSRTDAAGAQQMSYEEIKAAVDEAHRLGLKVA
ncbi:MAG TPA: amidohydrolase family protein, partial [Burkholderiaceae bacterium]|nr:amidohydrolase family protein [Burkholderiaceae bacterium]